MAGTGTKFICTADSTFSSRRALRMRSKAALLLKRAEGAVEMPMLDHPRWQ